MNKKKIFGIAALLVGLTVANKEKSTKSSKVIYADVKAPAPNDHSASDGGPGGTGTPI